MTTHALDVNVDHFAIWVHQMRTTTLPQATGHLAARTNDEDSESPIGFCCLGLGSLIVPDCKVYPYGDGDAAAAKAFGEWGATDLAPIEFILWLIPTYENDREAQEFDLVPAYPVGLVSQGQEVPEGRPPTGVEPFESFSAAKMNDDGFTFAQIADVFAHFGIGSVSPST